MPKAKQDIRSAMGLALSEILKRLTIEEKKELVKMIDWEELEKLRGQVMKERKQAISDPKVYIGTTPSGLSFEMPVEKVVEFLKSLARLLKPEKIESFIQKDGALEERSFPPEEFETFLDHHLDLIINGSIMIEFDKHTLISGGGGCLSLTLEDVPDDIKRQIADNFLRICGFNYRFTKGEFSAVVWKDKIKVSE